MFLRVWCGAPRRCSGKESACQGRRRSFDPWVGKIAWRRKWQPTPVFLPGKFHGQRSLVGYSLWGQTEQAGAIHLVTLQHHLFYLFLWQNMEKAMAPHSSTHAWKITWTEEPGRLQSMGSLRVGHDWVTSLSLFTFMQWRRKWQPTPVFLPGESQGRGSLVGCHLWGRTELDTTKVT